jgi:hypothetical protein
MRRKTLAAILLLALAAVLAACQGAEEEPTPTLTPTLEAQSRQQLEGLSTDALLSLVFPGVALAPLGSGDPFPVYAVEDEPSRSIVVLGRLTGHFTHRHKPQLAAFLYLGSADTDNQALPQSRVLELPEGLFMALIELDSQDRPALAGLSLLDSSAAELLEAAQALEQDIPPFRQGLDNLAPDGLISPALAVDTDNDGLDELVLLDAGLSDGVAAAFYLTFRWTASDLHWQRIAPPLEGTPADLPTQIVLHYLAGSDESISEELLHDVADDASATALAAARRKLQATRALFSEAYQLQSANRQKLQPWPDFVNGFRNATGAEVEEMLPPSLEDAQASVQVVIIAFSREGPDLVQRRFRVTYELIRGEEGWRLDDVDAKEERPSE